MSTPDLLVCGALTIGALVLLIGVLVREGIGPGEVGPDDDNEA